MAANLLSRFIGRSLLRDQRPHKGHPVGACPRCGRALVGSTGSWFQAECLLDEHLRICRNSQPAVTVSPLVGSTLRSA
jgi:hypothetical protein